MGYEIFNVDAFEWMSECPKDSFQSIVTDPPYGVREFQSSEVFKMRVNKGGIWRIPPRFDGAQRKPLPRFTVLNEEDKKGLQLFFLEFGRLAIDVLVPGGHVIIASNPILSHRVAISMEEAGFEVRGNIVRLVRTFRGGDRPKNAHEEFDMVSSMPRACWEPWLLFRKPLEGRLSDNLEKWQAGGLRRLSEETPLLDVVRVERTPKRETEIAPHPTLKPQALMRQLVWASLPLGKGKVLDPFMGAGSTIAAAEHLGMESVGLEIDETFFEMAKSAIPRLSSLPTPQREMNRTRTIESFLD